jgi:methyl-accepting chemotaxis protein
VVNGTFYLDLALGQTIAWVDPRLTLRWETIVYLVSVALALAWFGLAHTAMPTAPTALVAAGLALATVGSVYVIRLGVRADELHLIQRLAQAIAAEMNLSRSFGRVQQLTRQLVPWEQMGFARYDARARQMELLADTAQQSGAVFRFDVDAGLSGEAVRLRRAVVAHGLAKDQVVVPGAETPGAEMLVPLYHAGQLVGLWSVRHSDPAMYRDSDGELLDLLAPQLALMVAIEASLRPVTGASDQTTQYVQTLTATTEEIQASSEEVAASAQRASDGAGQAATLVTAAAREAEQLQQSATELATAGDRTRDAGSQMEKTAEKVRTGTQGAVRQLTDLGATTEESAAEVRRLRDVATQVEKFSETIGFVANQTNLLALNATIEAARAGVHGRGFAVVADEVHKLAEESGREARNVGKSVQDTRRALDRAAHLLERIRGDLVEVVQNSADWVEDLGRITDAAAETARAGKRVAEVARHSAELAARITQALGQARAAAQTSTQEAEGVAAAAAEQLRAIEDLVNGATDLSALADKLSQAVRFMRGENGHR